MGNIRAIVSLIDGGVPALLHDGSQKNDSTLHWACSFSNMEVAELLLSHGVDVNVLNSELQSPLHLAVKSANIAIIELLLQSGADASLLDSNHRRPLDMLPKENADITQLFEKYQTTSSSQRHAGSKHVVFSVNGEERPVAAASTNAESTATDFESSAFATLREGLEDAEAAHRHNGEHQGAFDDQFSEPPPLLVLWPPAQRQTVHALRPLVLSSGETVLICVASPDVDVYPLLTWSGLVDILEGLGLHAQVKRTLTNSAIRICIDSALCPLRHSFDLSVTPAGIRLVGADSTGLFYGVLALTQLIQMHSTISFNGEYTLISVPSVSMLDWPSTANRAALWSYRQHARTSSTVMRRSVSTLARMRINQLLLVLDPLGAEEQGVGHLHEGSESKYVGDENKVCSVSLQCSLH